MFASPRFYSLELYLGLGLGLSIAIPHAAAIPSVVDDRYDVVEDEPFIASSGPVAAANFDGVLDGDWSYLDRIENANGAAHGYPTDSSSRAWNAPDFDTATSTIGPWSSGPAPMQSGGINAFASAPTTLLGIDAADNGQNLITTYLFRNTFTLTEAEAAVASWDFSHVLDDAAIVYVNGVEVFRTSNMPAGAPTTATLANGSIPDENNYTVTAGVDLSGRLVTGVNSIAVELHQATLTSSDVGFDLTLAPTSGGPTPGGPTYVDDPFGGSYASSAPGFASGEVTAAGGFGGSGGASVRVGVNARAPSAGAWRLQFTIAEAATLPVSFRYRMVADGGYESAEFSDALFAADGVFYGEGGNDYIVRLRGDGNSGPDMDTGWQTFSVEIPFAAGQHTLDFGVYNNRSTIASELTDIFIDDIVVGFGSGPGGVLANDSGLPSGLSATLATPPTDGSVTLASDGTFVYTPDPNFNGTDSFTYTATDSSGTSAPATVTLDVAAVNDPPTAGARAVSVSEDTTLSVAAASGLALQAADIEGDPLTFVLGDDVSNGSLSLAADGGFTYTPGANFSGVDGFTYMAEDGAGARSDPAQVTITVDPVNDPPVAVDDQYRTDENEALEIDLALRTAPLVVFSTDFDSVAPPELSGVTTLESSGAFAGLGNGGDTFGGSFLRNRTSGDPADRTVITLDGLPRHNRISIGFLLAVIDSWDGGGSGFRDDFNILVDGNPVFIHTFENSGGGTQTYTPPAGGELARKIDLGFGSGAPYVDSAYDMNLEPSLRSIVHTSPQVTIEIFSSGFRWTGGDDESWAIDNLVVGVSDSDEDELVARGSEWRYLDDGSDQGTAWRAPAFDDSAWASAPAELGYGDGDEATVVSFGPDAGDKFPTTYFRRSFSVVDPAQYLTATLGVRFDDGVAVYLNGTEVARGNLAGAAAFDTLADVSTAFETTFVQFPVDPSLFVAGDNVLAVEVHQGSANSSDLSFDLWLSGQRNGDSGVLGNDFDIDSQDLTASLLAPPGNGVATVNPDGTFTYTPGLNFQGEDTFTYTVSDGESADTAEVRITVIPGPNDLPVTVADSYATGEDVPLVVPAAAGVLDNDSDPDGDSLTAVVDVPPAGGVLALSADGSFVYFPNGDFNGTDSFHYRADDGQGRSAPTRVDIQVAPSNDPPVSQPDSYLMAPGGSLAVASPGVLGNDSDVDGDALAAEVVTPPAVGLLSLSPGGGLTYTPPAGFNGQASFTYRARDASLASSPATVTVDVNGAPTAGAVGFTVLEDQTLSRSGASGVLQNSSDPEGDGLTATLVGPPAHGQLSLSPDGGFTYTPVQDYHGPDSFTFRVSDGLQDSALATATISVTPVDDPPVASGDKYFVVVGQGVAIPAGEGVLANDADVDGDAMVAQLQSDVGAGTLALDGDGSFTYTPNPGFSGTDSFTYTANAGGIASAPATVTLLVGAAADSVLISEIMFHPASDDDAEEFVELTNISSGEIPLGGWRFTSGVTFDFPAVTIPPGGRVVVAADPAAFTAAYGTGPVVVGPWAGRLSNSGEKVRIEDNLGREVDDITYADQGDWARRRAETNATVLQGEEGWRWDNPADGGGSSLEVVNLEISNRHGQNWAPSSGPPTPGAANSVASTDTAPLVLDVKHSPGIPRPGEAVAVTAELRDGDGETLSAALHWRVSEISPGPFSVQPMFDDGAHGDGAAGDGEFGAFVPGQPDGTVVEFYVAASDGGNSRTWPAPSDGAGAQGANALFQFDSEEYSGDQPIYRLIMTAGEDDAFRFANFNGNSDAQKNATLVARQGSDIDVRYLCGVRVRGAGSRGRNPRNNRLNIPRDTPWNGVSRINLNTQYIYLQLLGSKLAAASGIEAADAKPVQLRHNGVNRALDNQNTRRYGSYLHIEPIDGDWAGRHYPGDPDGNVYSKGRPDVKWDVRTAGGGPDAGAYRADGWSKSSNESRDDWSDLHELFISMNGAAGPGYLGQVSDVIDHDQWARWFAFMTIVLSRETNLSNGTDDDYKMYRGITDPRFKLVPHDFDTIFGLGDTSADPTDTLFPAITSFAGQTFPQLVPFFDDPEIARLHYAHMRELLETVFAKPAFDATVANCLDWVPEGVREDIISFMDTRRAHILSGIPSGFTVSSSLPVSNGLPQADEADITGINGTLDAARTAAVRVNGIEVSIDPRAGTWDGGSLPPDTLLAPGSSWRYLDDGSDQGTAWQAPSFDDSAWKTGVAELGYGGRGEVTVVDFGPDPDNKHITTYFRTTFEVADPAAYANATLRLVYDDGAAVYLNGTEVLRRNLGAGAPYDELASETVVDAVFEDFAIPVGLLQAGTNTIAVEVHNVAANNIDISMDAAVVASAPPLSLLPGLNNLHVEALDENGTVIDRGDLTVWYNTGSTAPVSGTIASDTTWTAAAGPYLVTGDIVVPAGVTLTIEPGTSVYFADGTRMTVRGRLLAEGTAGRHITFAQQPGTAGGWDGVYFENTPSDNRMAYVDQDGSDAASHSLGVTDSRLRLDHVRWTGTTETVLEVSGPQLDVVACDFPSTSGSEVIHGLVLAGDDYFNLVGNLFRTSSGYNDIIDFSGGRRPGPIIYVIGNTFTGGTDDCLDFDGIDAHIEGNVFMNIHTDDPARESTSNAIATDGSAHITVVRNLFVDVDHALLLKNHSDAIFENNTVVGATIAAINFDEPVRSGVVPGDGITMRGNIFRDNAAMFANQFAAPGEDDPVIAASLNILPAAHHGLGQGNIDTDPLFADPAAGDYTLAPGSPASGSGINGADMGYAVPAGATVSGEPPALTRDTGATLAVHMPGISGIEGGSFITEYRWRLDGGAWSAPVPVSTPLALAGLADGEHQVEVVGKDSGGVWQDFAEATASRRWTVDSSLSRLVINEVLADNGGAFNHEGTQPDFVEIWNDSTAARDLSGMVLSDVNSRVLGWSFPAGTVVPAGGYLVVFANAPDGTSGLHTGFGLDNDGEGVFLFDTAANGGGLLDGVEFGFQLRDRSIGRAGQAGAFAPMLPTPGAANGAAVPLGSPRGLLINEWLATNGFVYDNDFLELFNPTGLPVALGGLSLSDDPNNDPARHRVAALSFIGASGFVKFIADNDPGQGPSHLSFGLSKLLESVGLFDSDGTEIDRVQFNNGVDDVSGGRATDGSPLFADFALPTPGFSNGTDLSEETRVLGGLRIVELMYNPPGGRGHEYLKLQNVGDTAIPLGDVQFDEGISFRFPASNLAPGGVAYIASDTAGFEAAYGTALNLVGEYGGQLSNGGERVRMEIASLSAGILDFQFDDAWYPETDGGGASLVVVDPGGATANWSLKSGWRASGPAGSSYDEWVVAQFGAPAVGVTGKGDDPDLDGIANLAEFALGLDPNAADPAAALPQVAVENGFLTLTYTTAHLPVGVTVTPQLSADCAAWADAGGAVSVQLLSDDGTLRTYKATDSQAIATAPGRFLRLKIECP